MRILAVSSYAGLGGAELSFASFLEHRPQHVVAEAILIADGPLRERIAELGITTTAFPWLEGRPRPRTAARFGRMLTVQLRANRPDLVWAVGQKAALLCALPSRLARVPLVWHKVDFSWDRLLSLPLAAASVGVITTSRALAEPLGRFGSRHLGVVWPPVRLPESTRGPGSRSAIGTLGRLVPYKGHHLIVRAAALLSPEFPDLRVVLAGGRTAEYPGYHDELVRLAEQLELADRVELTGHVEDVAAVLDRLAVFVNATYRDEDGFGLEGLSGAVLEASWAGLPVVATNAGGTAEQIVPGETGTLVAKPTPDALAAAIAPYLRDEGLAARTGEAGHRFVRAARVEPAAAAARLFGLLEGAANERA